MDILEMVIRRARAPEPPRYFLLGRFLVVADGVLCRAVQPVHFVVVVQRCIEALMARHGLYLHGRGAPANRRRDGGVAQ